MLDNKREDAGINELDALFGELKPMLASMGVDVTPPSTAEINRQLAELSEAIAPWKVHPHTAWFWRTWPQGAREVMRPCATDPTWALHCHNDPSAEWPVVAIGYEGHCDLLAEVQVDDGPPRIYISPFYDDGARLIFSGFADLLRYLIVTVEDNDNRFGVDFQERIEQLQTWLPPAIHERDKQPIDAADSWPDRWREATGLTDDDFRLRGATHTVAQLEAERRNGPLTCTMHVRIATLAGSATGSVVRISDDSGSMQAHIPASTRDHGESSSGLYEVEISAVRLTGPETTVDDFRGGIGAIQGEALAGNIEAMYEAVHEHIIPLGRHVSGDHPVIITARRPINP